MNKNAIKWAFDTDVKRASTKLVLVTLARFAKKDGTCNMMIGDIAFHTRLDNNSVLRQLERLRKAGYIADTGKRDPGASGVTIYRLIDPVFGLI